MLSIILTILLVMALFTLGCFILLNSLEERYKEMEDKENEENIY